MEHGIVSLKGENISVAVEISDNFLNLSSVIIHFPVDADISNWSHCVAIKKDLKKIENLETIECPFIIDICPFEDSVCDNCIYYDPDFLKLTEDELPY